MLPTVNSLVILSGETSEAEIVWIRLFRAGGGVYKWPTSTIQWKESRANGVSFHSYYPVPIFFPSVLWFLPQADFDDCATHEIVLILLLHRGVIWKETFLFVGGSLTHHKVGPSKHSAWTSLNHCIVRRGSLPASSQSCLPRELCSPPPTMRNALTVIFRTQFPTWHTTCTTLFNTQ